MTVRTVRSRPPTRRARSFALALRALQAFLLLLVPAAPTPALAQLIGIKTVPIADGDQFNLFPSRNHGIGGISLALDDTLLDPFRNPASGARLGAGQFFGSPVLYSVSDGAGGGKTLPLGVFARAGHWFGATAIAAQQIEEVRERFPGAVAIDDRLAPSSGLDLADPPRHNVYAFGMLGRRFDERRAAVGASIQWAALNAVDGVDLLYAGSQHLAQSGGLLDLRVGLVKEWEGGRTIEAVAVHNRFRMTHDVTYVDWFWDPVQRTTVPRGRVEHNPDRTNIWGLHLQHERPLTSDGWRIGGLLTANRMSHPKIPNYEIMNIPRDPGWSNAFNAGLGVARTQGPVTFALEAIYEPIWSDTWSDSETPVETTSGAVIQPGGRIIENDFRFSNALVRMGVAREIELEGGASAATFQLGLAVRSISYDLDQYDNVQARARWLKESWVEWMPTWGFSLRSAHLEIRYAGRRTHGTGRPGVAAPPMGVMAPDAVSSRTVLLAPSGALTLDEVRVTTHQVSISLPLR
ncbi:MAG TPA: hypothetical protein VMM18_12070 [Gemmatimonadaceae bacterium]|nr:hypothetical protein [Gemmatimonadaceae bacterium]